MWNLPTNLVDLFRASGGLVEQRILVLIQAWGRACKSKSQKWQCNTSNFDKLAETWWLPRTGCSLKVEICGEWLKITNGTSEKALRGVVIIEFSYDNWIGFGTKSIARVYIYSWSCNAIGVDLREAKKQSCCKKIESSIKKKS